MGVVSKQLGQIRPSTTNPTVLYSPEKGKSGIVKAIIVCNVTANTPTFRIFHSYSGSEADQDTALFYDVAMTASETKIIEFAIAVKDGATLQVRASAADEINFTAYGTETSR